jgi:hypothetical protein
MEKEFVPFELALKLKELGFKERCLTYYGGDKPMIYDGLTIHGWDHNTSFLNWTSRPTFSQAFRWFRDKYELYSWITMELESTLTFCWIVTGENKCTEHKAFFKSYEEAELSCLEKLIEIITKQQNQ